MKAALPSQSLLLLRHAAAAAARAERQLLRHLFAALPAEPERLESGPVEETFDSAELSLPLLSQDAPWPGVLAAAMRRTASIFADPALAARAAGVPGGAGMEPGLRALVPWCVALDAALHRDGADFLKVRAAELREGQKEARAAFAAALPEARVPGLGSARAWLPDFVGAVAQAALLGELARSEELSRTVGGAVAEFFAAVLKAAGAGDIAAPTAEQATAAVRGYGSTAAKFAVGQVTSLLESQPGEALEAALAPFLVGALASPLPLPGQSRLKKESPVLTAPPVLQPAQKPAPKPVVVEDDEDDDEALPVRRDYRGIVITSVVALLALAALGPVLRGLFGQPERPVEAPPEPPTLPASATPPQREKMLVSTPEPAALAEPSPLLPAPAVKAGPLDLAARATAAAAHHRSVGEHREAAEQLSRALLAMKDHWGELRWEEDRYKQTRAELRAELTALGYAAGHIAAVERLLAAEPPKDAPAAPPQENLPPAAAVAAARRAVEEISKGRPAAAALEYENALRICRAELGAGAEQHRYYQGLFSRYLDFLIAEELPQEDVQQRVELLRQGKKLPPLPRRAAAQEDDGLGLPRL